MQNKILIRSSVALVANMIFEKKNVGVIKIVLINENSFENIKGLSKFYKRFLIAIFHIHLIEILIYFHLPSICVANRK